MDAAARRAHWEQVHRAKAPEETSWFQSSPARSLALLERFAALDRPAGPDRPAVRVIDVGGGASSLVDALLARGDVAPTVLDVSGAALARARTRLGDAASRVAWIESDVLDFAPSHRYDAWHDRAAFHFLTDPADRARYGAVLRAALAPDGVAIIAGFAPDGPEQCSNLPVRRADGAAIAAALGEGFVLVHEERETHHTPWGKAQSFCWAVVRRG